MLGMGINSNIMGFYSPELECPVCWQRVHTNFWPFFTKKIHNSWCWAQIGCEVCAKNVGMEVLKLLNKTYDLIFGLSDVVLCWLQALGVIFALRFYWFFLTRSSRQPRLLLNYKRYWSKTLQAHQGVSEEPRKNFWGKFNIKWLKYPEFKYPPSNWEFQNPPNLLAKLWNTISPVFWSLLTWNNFFWVAWWPLWWASWDLPWLTEGFPSCFWWPQRHSGA